MFGSTKKNLRIRTKLPYLIFEDWYLDHPGIPPEEIADEFQVSLRTIYNKLEHFNKRHGAKVDIRLTSISLDAYKEGYATGFIVGAAISGLTADLLKTHGIGISDLVAWIAKYVKGDNGKTQTQSPQP